MPASTCNDDSEVYRKCVLRLATGVSWLHVLMLAAWLHDLMLAACRCLLAGFFANVAVLQPNQSYKVRNFVPDALCADVTWALQVLASGQEALIHPSSCLAATRPKPQCILFNELIQTSKQYMRSCCILDQVRHACSTCVWEIELNYGCRSGWWT